MFSLSGFCLAALCALFLTGCLTLDQSPYSPLPGTKAASPELTAQLKREWRVRQNAWGIEKPLSQPPDLRIQDGIVYAARIYNLQGADTIETHFAYWLPERKAYYVQIRGEEGGPYGGTVNRWFGPYPLDISPDLNPGLDEKDDPDNPGRPPQNLP